MILLEVLCSIAFILCPIVLIPARIDLGDFTINSESIPDILWIYIISFLSIMAVFFSYDYFVSSIGFMSWLSSTVLRNYIFIICICKTLIIGTLLSYNYIYKKYYFI